jgi:hypothetical protein
MRHGCLYLAVLKKCVAKSKGSFGTPWEEPCFGLKLLLRFLPLLCTLVDLSQSELRSRQIRLNVECRLVFIFGVSPSRKSPIISG